MNVIVWSKNPCPYCDQAKALLKSRGIAFEERNLTTGNWTKEQLLEAVPTARTVPQIIINDRTVGGFTELRKYIEETAGGFGDSQG
jgi:glutaredoxin 3